MSDDDELQAHRDRVAGKPAAPRPPTLAEWTYHDELLTTITDAANAIRTTVASLGTEKGKRPPQFKPAKRPLTAVERAERRRDRETVKEIVALMRPRDVEG